MTLLLPWMLGVGSVVCLSVVMVLNLREHLRAPWVDASGPVRYRLAATLDQLHDATLSNGAESGIVSVESFVRIAQP